MSLILGTGSELSSISPTTPNFLPVVPNLGFSRRKFQPDPNPPTEEDEQWNEDLEKLRRTKLFVKIVNLLGLAGIVLPLFAAVEAPLFFLSPNLLLAKSLALASIPVGVASLGRRRRSLEDADDSLPFDYVGGNLEQLLDQIRRSSRGDRKHKAFLLFHWLQNRRTNLEQKDDEDVKNNGNNNSSSTEIIDGIIKDKEPDVGVEATTPTVMTPTPSGVEDIKNLVTTESEGVTSSPSLQEGQNETSIITSTTPPSTNPGKPPQPQRDQCLQRIACERLYLNFPQIFKNRPPEDRGQRTMIRFRGGKNPPKRKNLVKYALSKIENNNNRGTMNNRGKNKVPPPGIPPLPPKDLTNWFTPPLEPKTTTRAPFKPKSTTKPKDGEEPEPEVEQMNLIGHNPCLKYKCSIMMM